VTRSPADPLRVLFVNENLGGHATMHLAIREELSTHRDVEARFIDVPRAGLSRRFFSAPLPFLAGHDLDLQPLRAILAQSLLVRGRLRRAALFDVLHVYTQQAALLSASIVRDHASVVSTDATGVQSAALLPYRTSGLGTTARVRLQRRWEDRVFRNATHVIAKSEWAAASLRNDYGVPTDRLSVIPFGVSVPRSLPERREAVGLPEVTFVGTTMERKGGWRLLRVFRRSLRDRCVLNIVTHEAVAPEPGVRVLGDLRPGDPRLDELLARTAVFAFPSRIDTFGNAAVEAMAREVPVVAARVNALPEIVEDGLTGLLVAPGDDDELEAAISCLLDNEERRVQMGRAARMRVLERFDARVTTARLLDVLRACKRSR
jgi:alpha-maltose-1-phosphate synthase